MAAKAKLLQERSAVTVHGTPKFRIISAVSDKGPLPDTGVFVHSLHDRASPQRDVFERVASVADLEELPVTRSAALASGVTLYRSSQMIKYYNEVGTAVTASRLIKDGVDSLVNTWVEYSSNFLTGPEDEETEYPRLDGTLLKSLVDQYSTLQNQLGTINADRVKTATDIASLETSITMSEARLSALRTIKNNNTAATDAAQAVDTTTAQFLSMCRRLGSPPAELGATATAGSGFFRNINSSVYMLDDIAQSMYSEAAKYAGAVNYGPLQGFIDDLVAETDLLKEYAASLGAEKQTMCAGLNLDTDIQSKIDSNGLDTVIVELEAQMSTDKQALTLAQIKLRELDADHESMSDRISDALNDIYSICPTYDISNL